MPVLPLEHFEPFAATLGVMLYPGLDEDDQRKARAFAAQWLAIPVRRLYEAGHTMPNDALARIVMDGGTLLTDTFPKIISARIRGAVRPKRDCRRWRPIN